VVVIDDLPMGKVTHAAIYDGRGAMVGSASLLRTFDIIQQGDGLAFNKGDIRVRID